MKRNGTTKAGTQRWRCTGCGASAVRRIDSSAKALRAFLRWLLSKDSIADLKTSRATFWRRTAWIWRIWPIAPGTGEVHDVVFLDGIWLRRRAVVLIACANGHVVAWHLARSECTSAWAALMARIPAPSMAVSDGSTGLAKAASIMWPATRIQRCTFHAANQVKRCTTLRPKLEAGIELLGIANALAEVDGADAAAAWLLGYNEWCAKWESFLKEFTVRDGRKVWTHERLRKARGSLNKLVREGTLFTFVKMGQERGGRWPATNNAIESVNARLREMLRLHRGFPSCTASRPSSGGATCTPSTRWALRRSYGSCPPTTTWTGCSQRHPGSLRATTGPLWSTAQGSIGTSSTCPRNSGGE